MQLKEVHFNVEVYKSIDELDKADAALLNTARKAAGDAYAPYSKFYVGAAAMLNNGKTVVGTNQENAAYPVGICAERVLLSSVSSQFPNEPVKTMAISYKSENVQSDHPISPCGICRQTLVEYEERTKTPIRLILSGSAGEVFIIETAKQLLPLSFTSSDLVK